MKSRSGNSCPKAKPPKRLEIYQWPVRLLTVIIVTIFVIHLLAMALFALWPGWPHWMEWAVESILLVILLFPVLYYFSFRPLLVYLNETQQAEEQMRESEHKYRHLFESLSDAALLVDVETGRVLDANKQAERLLSRTRGEIMGMNQSQLHPPEKVQEHRARFTALSREERCSDFDGEMVDKNGKLIPVHIGAAPITLHERRLVLALCRARNPGRSSAEMRAGA